MPWGEADVLRLCSTWTIGLVSITVSWYGISGSGDTSLQALWFNIGIAGAVISALGNGVWLLRGRRAVGDRRAALVSLEVPTPVTQARSVAAPSRAATDAHELVRVAGMTRVHRVVCPLVVGKRCEPARLDDGEPCGVCSP